MQAVDFYFWLFVTFVATFSGYTGYMIYCITKKDYKSFLCLVVLQCICAMLVLFCLQQFREELHRNDNLCNLPISVD